MVSRTTATALLLLTLAVMIAPTALADPQPEDAPEHQEPCTWLYILPDRIPPVDLHPECIGSLLP